MSDDRKKRHEIFKKENGLILPDPFESYKKNVFGDSFTFQEKIKKAYSMLSEERMNNIYHTLAWVIKDQIPGDFVETGVWKGGGSILLLLF